MNNIFTNNIKKIEFDALIIGGGGSGMRASLELAKSGLKTAVVSKVFPTRSHTVSAQGGITCAIASAVIRAVAQAQVHRRSCGKCINRPSASWLLSTCTHCGPTGCPEPFFE